MQKVKFGKRVHGMSESGRPYDFVELSDGFSSFQAENTLGDQIDELQRGQDVEVELHVEAGFKGIRARLVDIQVA